MNRVHQYITIAELLIRLWSSGKTPCIKDCSSDTTVRTSSLIVLLLMSMSLQVLFVIKKSHYSPYEKYLEITYFCIMYFMNQCGGSFYLNTTTSLFTI